MTNNSKDNAGSKGSSNGNNKGSNLKRGYTIVISAGLAIIAALIVLIVIISRRDTPKPAVTDAPVLVATETLPQPDGTTDTVTAQPETATPLITAAPTEPPTEVPTPTVEPTEIPTPTPTAEPTPTEAPPTPTRSPTPRDPGGTTSANPKYEGKRLVALTFDDGPQAGSTEYMLDVLKKHNAKATFFVVGTQMAYPDNGKLTTRAAEEGHQIGNHSYSHPNFGKLSDEEIVSQRDRANELIIELTGKPSTLFRVPGGQRSKRIRELLALPLVQWDIDPLDWKFLNETYIKKYAAENGMSYDEAESALIDIILFEGLYTELDGYDIFSPPVAGEMKHGSILLFHDVYPASARAVDRLLTYLEDNFGNYVYLTFDEFIRSESDEGPQAGIIYFTMWSQPGEVR